jgi:catechol 2,3-dioxygenase-like lactoylglutathione lyase family enzyme
MSDRGGIGAIRGMGYVIVICDDFDRMRQFYIDLFGFQIEDEKPGQWIGFRVGTTFLGLRPRGRPYDGQSAKDGAASVQLSFQVPPADVDLAYETLLDMNIAVIEPPTNQDWCHRTLFFADPEANIIEIVADIHPRDKAALPSKLHQIASL